MAEMRVITSQELAENCGQRIESDDRPSSDKMWIAIDGWVYDITKFGDFHPGGNAVLKFVAGEDATEQFFSLHTKDVIKRYHDKFVIGKMADAGPPPTEPEDLISEVPYAELPLLRERWVRMPWWTDAHYDFLVECRKLFTSNAEELEKLERSGEYIPDKIQKLFGEEWGVLACLNGPSVMAAAQQVGIVLPNKLQPKDFDIWYEYAIHTEIARSIPVGVRNGIAGGMAISLPAIAQFATNMSLERKNAIVADVIRGNKRSCLAISEPQAGSDVANIVTIGKKSKCGKYYIVNGIKKWITSGMTAQYFATAVRTGGPGAKGVSLLLVDIEDGGVEVEHIKTSDSKTAATAWVYYDDAHVPVENLMGEENKGFQCIMANFNHERWMICVEALGGIRMILEKCFIWANSRKVFGKTLISQPVIRNKLARMVGTIEGLEGYMESVTYQMAHMDPFVQMVELGGAIAILKFQTTRAMTLVSDEACQIFGGRALTASGMGKEIEMLQRTFKFASILGGSEEIMADLGVRQAMLSFPENARL